MTEERAGRQLLSEAAAVEVLAYLVTAARTQIDEAAEYAPLRLMTAAQKLADGLSADASAPVRALIAAIAMLPVTAVPRSDRDAYIARVDEICVAAADCLLAVNPPGASL
jgi:hypothetical protein